MRKRALAIVLGLLVSAPGWAQVPAAPPVRIGNPQPATPMLPKLPPVPSAPSPEPLPTPMPIPGEVGAEVLPPGTVVSPPMVRPPMPVTGAPIEVPPGPTVWSSFEYLMWRAKGGLLPPLIAATFGDATMVAPHPLSAFPASNDRINSDIFDGFRVTAGYWLDKPHGTGVEARYTRLFHAEDVQNFTGTPRSFMVRPFWDESRDLPALFLLSTPSGTMQGLAQIRTSFDSEGFEGNYLMRGPTMIGEESHWIIGLRYWDLEEDLTIAAGSRAGGMGVGTFDTFATRNRFFGGQFGGRFNFTRNKLSIDLVLKLAAGAMVEEASITGGTNAVLPSGAAVSRPGGFLALPSNMGDHMRTKLAVIRDTTITVSYCVTENISLRLGYDMTMVYNVVRPGEQMSLNINPTLFPFSPAPRAPLLPSFRFNEEEFWMYGLSFGVAVQF
jgi:hypothetical protein